MQLQNSLGTELVQELIISKKQPTLIAFSSVNCPKGQFKPFKPLIGTEFNVLFVNDIGNRWYTNGIPNIADTPLESAEILVEHARKMGNGRVVTFGTSMGAFGAILYCVLGKADGALGFGLESPLQAPLTRSLLQVPKTTDLSIKDIKEIITSRKASLHIFQSDVDEIDMQTGISLKHLLNVHPISGAEHPSVQQFNDKNLLYPLLAKFAKSGKIDFPKSFKGTFCSINSIELLIQAALKRANGAKDNDILELLQSAVNDSPEAPLPLLRLAELFHRKNNSKEAEARLLKLIKAFPYQSQAYNKLAAVYLRLEKPELALPLIEKAVNLSPSNAYICHTAGRVYEALNKFKEAEEAYKSARIINKGNLDFKRSHIKILSKLIELYTDEVKNIEIEILAKSKK